MLVEHVRTNSDTSRRHLLADRVRSLSAKVIEHEAHAEHECCGNSLGASGEPVIPHARLHASKALRFSEMDSSGAALQE